MKTKYFTIEELVDKNTLKKYGEEFLWKTVFDYRILWQIDKLREYFGKPITINTWKVGGDLSFRGFRPFGCNIGATWSSHKFGRAIDFDVKGFSAEEVRQEILKNQKKECFQFIKRMEKDVSWVHIDCSNTNLFDIELFSA